LAVGQWAETEETEKTEKTETRADNTNGLWRYQSANAGLRHRWRDIQAADRVLGG